MSTFKAGDRVEYTGSTTLRRLGWTGTYKEDGTVRFDNGSLLFCHDCNLTRLSPENPIKAAKELLESKGYNVTPPPNEVVFHGYHGNRILVTPHRVRLGGHYSWLRPETMDKLVEAWATVKAEEARRSALA